MCVCYLNAVYRVGDWIAGNYVCVCLREAEIGAIRVSVCMFAERVRVWKRITAAGVLT